MARFPFPWLLAAGNNRFPSNYIMTSRKRGLARRDGSGTNEGAPAVNRDDLAPLTQIFERPAHRDPRNAVLLR